MERLFATSSLKVFEVFVPFCEHSLEDIFIVKVFLLHCKPNTVAKFLRWINLVSLWVAGFIHVVHAHSKLAKSISFCCCRRNWDISSNKLRNIISWRASSRFYILFGFTTFFWNEEEKAKPSRNITFPFFNYCRSRKIKDTSYRSIIFPWYFS